MRKINEPTKYAGSRNRMIDVKPGSRSAEFSGRIIEVAAASIAPRESTHRRLLLSRMPFNMDLDN